MSFAQPHVESPLARSATRARAIALRTRGIKHGPITRLMSPGDLGQVLKPFRIGTSLRASGRLG
jgi:hypothetical protein